MNHLYKIRCLSRSVLNLFTESEIGLSRLRIYEYTRPLKGDFKLFLQALWAELDLPNPTRAQYAIADYLQHGPKRLQIQAFRGVGKSWITGAFVLWTLFNDSEKKIMIISASKERADNMSIFLQKLIIETPWLSAYAPQIR